MRVFVCSDLHADASTAGVPRFEDASEALDRVADAAIAARAGAFVFAGDLTDPDSGPASLRSVALAVRTALKLSAAGVPSHWLAGNHDALEDGSGGTALGALAEVARWVPGIRVYEYPDARPLGRGAGDGWLLALPFTPTARAYDPELALYDLWADVGAGPLLVVGHLNVDGVLPGSETSEMPRGREVRFPVERLAELAAGRPVAQPVVVVHGHYHRAQVHMAEVGGRELPIHVPGSLLRLTFGEEDNDPGYLVLVV